MGSECWHQGPLAQARGGTGWGGAGRGGGGAPPAGAPPGSGGGRGTRGSPAPAPAPAPDPAPAPAPAPATMAGAPRPCGAAAGGPVRAGGYRADVDGLRCVAVLAVFLFHLEAGWCPGGFAGVDVFFCVSGYVVAGSLLRRPAAAAAGPRRLLAGFYSRRAKRLGPALLLVAALTALAAALLVDPAQPALRSYFDTGLLGLVGLSNNLLTSLRAPPPPPDAHLEGGKPAASLEALGGNPYFSHLFSSEESGSGAPPPTGAGSPSAGGRGAPAPHATPSLGGDEVAAHEHHFNPFTHTWSLGVEEQLYLLFPLLFLLGYRPGAAARPSRRRPVVLFSGLTAAALVAGGVTEGFDSTHAFYLMPCRLWEMLCGSALLAGQDLLESGAGSFEGSVQAFEAQEGGGEGGETPLSGALPREAAGGGDEEEGPSEENGKPAQKLASLPLWAVVAMDLGSAASIGTALALPSQGAIAAHLLAVGGTLVFIAVGCRGYRRLGRVPVPLFNSLRGSGSGLRRQDLLPSLPLALASVHALPLDRGFGAGFADGRGVRPLVRGGSANLPHSGARGAKMEAAASLARFCRVPSAHGTGSNFSRTSPRAPVRQAVRAAPGSGRGRTRLPYNGPWCLRGARPRGLRLPRLLPDPAREPLLFRTGVRPSGLLRVSGRGAGRAGGRGRPV